MERRGREESLRDGFAVGFDLGDFIEASGDATCFLDLVAECVGSHVVHRAHLFYAVSFDGGEELVPVVLGLAGFLQFLPVVGTGGLELFRTWVGAQGGDCGDVSEFARFAAMTNSSKGILTVSYILPRGYRIAHQPHSRVVVAVTKARFKVLETTLVPLQPVLDRKVTITQGDVLEVAFDFGVEVRVLYQFTVGAVGVDLLLDLVIGVPLHAANEDVSLDLTAVVAHELFGSPAGVVGLAVGRHRCVMPMMVGR